MKKLLILLAGAFISMISCNKAEYTKPSDKEIQLESPDKKIKLGSSTSALVAEINRTIGSDISVSIERIEHLKTGKGYYSIVSFKQKDGSTANMIFSSFVLNSSANKLIVHISEIKSTSTAMVAACYKFWCSPAGNCTNCQVVVEDPWGNPTLRCSCEGCHLHGQQVLCPQ